MIAARIARRVAPSPRRDLVGNLLFFKLDWREKHPGVMFAVLGVLVALTAALENFL